MDSDPTREAEMAASTEVVPDEPPAAADTAAVDEAGEAQETPPATRSSSDTDRYVCSTSHLEHPLLAV